MAVKQYRTLHSDMSTEAKSKAMNENEVSYTLTYFNLSSMASTARDLLAYGKANWKNNLIEITDWQQAPSATPFGVMPVLEIHNSTSEDVVVAEQMVIDLYLARKFKLLGKNDYEETVIQAVYSSSQYVRERYSVGVAWTGDNHKDTAVERFLVYFFPSWVKSTTKILEDNVKHGGTPGYFIGNELTLAEIHTANVLDYFSHQPIAKKIMELIPEDSLIWKSKALVEANPEIKAWRETDAYKSLALSSKTLYKRTLPKYAEEEGDA
ncbi:hypothetical protein BGW42_002835 [Actinomortierella wolfii]|nr:hypothetical protein BGW42_002835 [Actinomortierella wolfii]